MSKLNIVAWIFVPAVAIFLLYIMIDGSHKNKSLDKNLEYANAVILEFSSGPRMRHYIDYAFSANGVKYEGDGHHYPKSDSLLIGDSILVVYDKTNPNDNRTYRDYEQNKKERPFIIPLFILIGLVGWWRFRKK